MPSPPWRVWTAPDNRPAAPAPLAVARLQAAGADGRAWLERARAETAEPLPMLAGG